MQCEGTSERTGEWPSTYAPIIGLSKPLLHGAEELNKRRRIANKRRRIANRKLWVAEKRILFTNKRHSRKQRMPQIFVSKRKREDREQRTENLRGRRILFGKCTGALLYFNFERALSRRYVCVSFEPWVGLNRPQLWRLIRSHNVGLLRLSCPNLEMS